MNEPFIQIPLTKGLFVIIDADDEPAVSERAWFPHKGRNGRFYASCSHPYRGQLLMHRLILNVPSSLQVDHIDNNGLNNRRSNLRPATYLENSFNRKKHRPDSKSVFKGVSMASNGRWRSRIKVGDRKLELGRFDTEVEAALAYDAAAFELMGEFAFLNFHNVTVLS